MVIKGFISFQNALQNHPRISALPFHYLPRGSSSWGHLSQCQWAGYHSGLETTSGIAQTWTKSFLKKDYQSNSFNMAVESIQLQSLRHPSDWVLLTLHIDLLTDEAMFMGWNPWLGNSISLQSYDFCCSRSTIAYKTLFLNDPVFLWVCLTS